MIESSYIEDIFQYLMDEFELEICDAYHQEFCNDSWGRAYRDGFLPGNGKKRTRIKLIGNYSTMDEISKNYYDCIFKFPQNKEIYEKYDSAVKSISKKLQKKCKLKHCIIHQGFTNQIMFEFIYR